jgi:WD40 repeat protein
MNVLPAANCIHTILVTNHHDNIFVRLPLAGTEDGHIHKCSTSYSEQYLESYSGHIGPVYALQWSPFAPNLFLSCSGDWTIRMWQVRQG